MVRANLGWGAGARAMVKRALQSAVLVAVGASVPAAWSAGRAPASFAAASTPNLHVKSVSLGSASFSSAGSVTTVLTGSARTIINYQYLSVPAGTTLDFTQPSASSRVFNRIDGNMPSAIDGTIHSNGIVYLVNPAGIMFGNGAVIQVGKFYAAAAHMTDNDFAAGNDHFTNVTGTVTNAGTIQAGEVHLVGTQVANFGQILAGTSTGGGVVTMTSGKDVYIGTTDSPAGSPRIMVKVSSETSSANPGTGVTNGGTISAGQIRLGAGDLYAAGIYNNGVLKGQAITLDSGASTNITAGTVDASSATGKGGTIELLGHQVGITGGSVDASGATGGGTVLVGGAAHGGGGIAIAQDTVISSGATVRADGTGAGSSGGTVVAYSSEWTQVAGKVSAVGGTGGTGGFIETSSEGQLSIVQAPSAGLGGQWLMDPTDVTIGGGATTGGTFAGGLFTPGNNDTATVSASDISGALVAGTSVTINTSSADVNKTGNITSSSTITVTTTNLTPTTPAITLTLNALGAIALSGGITVSGPVAVNMVFNSAGTVGIGGNISTNGGSFTTNGASFSLAPATTLATAGGNIVLKNTAGVSISGTVTAGSGTIWSTGTSFTVVAGGSVSSTAAINILHTGNVVIDGPLSAGAGGSIAISGQSVDQAAAGVVTAGTLALAASGDDGGGSAVLLNLAANVVGTVGVSATEASAAVSVKANGALNLATIPALTGVPTGLPAFGAISGITTSAGAVTVAAGGTVSVSNPIAAAGQDVSITTTAGDINGVGANAIAARNVILNAAGGIGIAAPVVLTPSGNVLITTGGADAAGDASVDFTGAIATSKITTLTNTNASQVGLTFDFLSNGVFTVDSAFGAAAENVTINAVGNAVVDSGANTLTGAVLTVTAGTTVGAAGSPLVFSEGTSAAFTSGGNVFVSSGAYTNPLTFTTDATPRTIELSGTAVTIGTNIAAGASNTLVVAGSTSVTVNAGETLSGSTVYVVSGGDIALAGDVSAGSTALFQGNSVAESTGTISALTVGVETSGALAGVSIDLSGANSIGTFALSASGASGTMAIRSTTGLSSGNVGAFSPSGVTAFGALTGTNGNGQNVVVSAGGTLALTAGITSMGANVSLTANGFSSNLVESGGTVSAGNITVNVTGGVGTSGVPVLAATLGNLNVTTAGTGAAGDIFVAVQNLFKTSNLTVATGGGAGGSWCRCNRTGCSRWIRLLRGGRMM